MRFTVDGFVNKMSAGCWPVPLSYADFAAAV